MPKPPEKENENVSNLIEPMTGVWDWQKHMEFWPKDREEIMHLPLGNPCNADHLVWHYNNSGMFTVRSAYHLVIN